MEEEPLIFRIVSGWPTNGVLSAFNATNGTVTYTPNPNYTAIDILSFSASDRVTESSPATVGISVTAIAACDLHPTAKPDRSAGQPVSFSVTATGTGPLQYQWNRGSNPVPGANSSTFTINAVRKSDAGNYTVTVTIWRVP